MDYLKLNENVCRICLESNIILNWNEEIFASCGMTYKDCYYKYTQLNENNSDCYPTNLCESCSNGLRNAHMLLEKALESFNILRIALDDNKYILPDEEPLIEIVKSPIFERESKKENFVNNSEEILIKEDIAIETGHFVDINNFETPLEQELVESSNIKSAKKTISKRKKIKPINESSLEPSVVKSSITKTDGNGRENCKSLPKTSYYDSKLPKKLSVKKVNRTTTLLSERLEQDNIDTSDRKSPPPKLPERKQVKKKLCQYCSLKVRVCYIKSHEATHNENRERKETCPQCGIKLYNKVALSLHMVTHRENRQKDHKCEFCEKAFFSKGTLNVHRRIHLGLMVKCHICSKEYYRQVDLNRHLVIHSAILPEKSGKKVKYTIQCQFCNKNISTNNWREHKAAHLNQPQTKCKICNKDFFSRSSCVNHLRKVHRTRELDKFIYYHVDPNTRMSHLMMVQQEKVQPRVK